jgi:peptide deformylase
MAVREIRLFGDPVLKTASEPVGEITESIKALIRDLEETTSLPGRAGVAANQVGVNLRAFSFHVEGQLGHLINPEIVDLSGELVIMDEGCLSLPEIWGKTPRHTKVKVRGLNVSGEAVELEAEGLLAQVMQHELDHLDGLVYLDRLEGDARKLCMAALRQTSWFMRD